MIDKQSTVVANFQEAGSTLKSLGKYDAAVIEVTNAFKFDKKTGESIEIIKTIESMKIRQEPTFGNSSKSVNFSNTFIEMCMERPRKPLRKATQTEWDYFQKFNRLNQEEKIEYHLNKYADDMGLILIDFNLS